MNISNPWHALYLESLGEAGGPIPPAMALALAANFGSVDHWRDEFRALGAAWDGGASALLLCFEPNEGRLRHVVAGPPPSGVPVLALDMQAHADRMGGDSSGAACATAFIGEIAWPAVYERYRHAVHAASEPLAASREQLHGALLLDVRRAGVFEQAAAMIPGAAWRDPAKVGEWADELPSDRELVVYCVYGHEVGRSTALQLHSRGLRARFLEGGIDGWQAAGQPLQPKGEVS